MFFTAEKRPDTIHDGRKTVGLIINPIAGMGGSVGLKGTDGKDILQKAISLGAEPTANLRAEQFLERLRPVASRLLFMVPPGVMGEDTVRKFGFDFEIVGELIHKPELFATDGSDTRKAAALIAKKGADLLIFVGGDGTARDVLEAVDSKIPCLGIPAGVKIHSSVFAINPESAAELTIRYLWGEVPVRESEVMDIDEEAFRRNIVSAKLYGYMLTPYSPLYTQPVKMASPLTDDEEANKEEIARWIIEEMKNEGRDIRYFIGPGTTTKKIADLLGEEKTLLGVDLMVNLKIIKKDLNERDILDNIIPEKSKLIITPIGRQGFIFGRGNLQITPAVIERIGIENIIIICTRYKFSTLPNGKLRADTRDPEMDKKLRGYYKVLVGYGEYRIVMLE